MKIKVSKASGPVLDWMVATGLGGKVRTENGVFLNQGAGYEYFTPSSSWEQGGPIIEREMRDHGFDLWAGAHTNGQCAATYARGAPDAYVFGPTPLIAAMRCYVASKLGDIVDVPEELTK